ncbi:MAG: hypothetical protein ABJO67_05005 [Pseudoruegeria sp.]
MKTNLKIATVGVSILLSACAPAPVVEQGILSSQARAVLPFEQDTSKIVRSTDGCYFEVMEGSIDGYLSPLQDPYHEGHHVCDQIASD